MGLQADMAVLLTFLLATADQPLAVFNIATTVWAVLNRKALVKALADHDRYPGGQSRRFRHGPDICRIDRRRYAHLCPHPSDDKAHIGSGTAGMRSTTTAPSQRLRAVHHRMDDVPAATPTWPTISHGVDVETSIEIDCPRAVVAAFVSNPDNATRWYVNIKSINWETLHRRMSGHGSPSWRSSSAGELPTPARSEKSSKVGGSCMSTAEGPFPMQTTYSWEDTSTGATRMMLRNAGEPSGFGKSPLR